MSERKKMSKAEAGRIGGMTTKKRHGIEHYRAIGKVGFDAMARKHTGNVRKAAVQWLQSQGKLKPVRLATAAQVIALWEQVTGNTHTGLGSGLSSQTKGE
jgi:hypothetical protein